MKNNMKYVQALLESNETASLLQENQVLIEQATQDLGNFYGVLSNYITENLVEFLDENLEETAKNIYTFATYATKQMLTEISTVYGASIHQNEILKEAARTEFV